MSVVSVNVDANGIATITFNKPPANSYDRDFMKDFGNAIDSVSDWSASRVVVITSEVPRIFCAGADLDAFRAQIPYDRSATADAANAVLNRLEALSQPVIAAINGHALGGGLEIALACDIRFLLRETNGRPVRLGLPETNLGLMPGDGGTQRLPRLIGQGRAMDHTLTGADISADEALAWGLVNRVLDSPEELIAAVEQYALTLAHRAPLALAASKRAIIGGAGLPLQQGLAIEAVQLRELFATNDAEEGMTAFAEKREPVWTGK